MFKNALNGSVLCHLEMHNSLWFYTVGGVQYTGTWCDAYVNVCRTSMLPLNDSYG